MLYYIKKTILLHVYVISLFSAPTLHLFLGSPMFLLPLGDILIIPLGSV